MDVIRVDGQLRTVIQIEWPGDIVGTEPLGDLLARHVLVDERSSLCLADVLIDAGWTPPT